MFQEKYQLSAGGDAFNREVDLNFDGKLDMIVTRRSTCTIDGCEHFVYINLGGRCYQRVLLDFGHVEVLGEVVNGYKKLRFRSSVDRVGVPQLSRVRVFAFDATTGLYAFSRLAN